MPSLIHNGVNIDKIYHNGVEVKEVYHNGIKVYPDWIEVPNAKNNITANNMTYNGSSFFYAPQSWQPKSPYHIGVNKANDHYFVKVTEIMIQHSYPSGYGAVTFGNLLPTTKDIEQVRIKFKTLDYDRRGAKIEYYLYLGSHSRYLNSTSLPLIQTNFTNKLNQGKHYVTNAFASYNGSDFQPNIQKEIILTFKNQGEYFLKSLGILMNITVINRTYLTPAGLHDFELYYKLKGQ